MGLTPVEVEFCARGTRAVYRPKGAAVEIVQEWEEGRLVLRALRGPAEVLDRRWRRFCGDVPRSVRGRLAEARLSAGQRTRWAAGRDFKDPRALCAELGLRPIFLDLEQLAVVESARIWRAVEAEAVPARITLRWREAVAMSDFLKLGFARELAAGAFGGPEARRVRLSAVTLGEGLWLHRLPLRGHDGRLTTPDLTYTL